MLTRVAIGASVWVGILVLLALCWIAYHEVVWRLRQRRRRRVPMEFGGRQL